MPTAQIEFRRLAAAAAIAYFQSKITDAEADPFLSVSARADAVFAVAHAKGRLLSDIRAALLAAITEGYSVQRFLDSFDLISDRYSGPRAWRAQQIYTENLRAAYAAGRYAQMVKVSGDRPYWEWRHTADQPYPRLNHKALNRRVFPANSLPFYPPLGFGCKCQVFSLSQSDLERDGLVSEPIEPDSVQVDPGFNRIPGQSTEAQRRAILEALDPEFREQAAQEAGLG